MDTLHQLEQALKTYDPYHVYSDDHKVYMAGEQKSREIESLIAQARMAGKDEQLNALLEKYGRKPH